MFGTSFSDYLAGADLGAEDYDPSDPLGLRKYRRRKLYPGGPPVGGSTGSSFFPSAPAAAPNSSPPKDRPEGDDSEDGAAGTPGAPLSRSARGLAIMNLGLGIASGAGTNDYAGGLARGIAGFTNTVQSERQAAVAEAAQRRKDERQAKLDELEARSKEATIGHVTAETHSLEDTRAHNLTSWQHEEQKRGNTPGTAAAMVANIETAAGKDSQEAAQARALASLGEDVDLNRLAELHDRIIARSHLGEDAGAKLQGEIPGLKAQITAGVREDPAEAARTRKISLGYEGQRVALEGRKVTAYEGQVSKQANRDPSPEQIQDDIARETDRIFQPARTALDERAKNPLGLQSMKTGPDGKPLRDAKGRVQILPPPTQADYDRERQKAELQARKNVQSRLDAIRQTRGVPAGKYHYNPATGELEPE